MRPTVILINPWIYDFAAYDLWAKPLGLLYLAGHIRSVGVAVHLIDCLDVHNPHMGTTGDGKGPVRHQYGTGKFWKNRVPKPHQLTSIKRTYSRYGIDPQIFIKELKKVQRPVAILITSLMTYWYPGVFEVIRLAKDIHPGIPVILGGIYATLCPEHAKRYSQADIILSSPGQYWLATLYEIFSKIIPGFSGKKKIEPFFPYPAFDLLTPLDYICISSSFGCPFKCTYCASHYLSPRFVKREPLQLLEEVLFWHMTYNVRDFAFYDDALLVDAKDHICLFLEEVVRRKLAVRFHCPNGIHITFIDKGIANLLHRAGFTTIRLGLETSDTELLRDLGEKFTGGEFERVVTYLKKAGFTTDQIGAYFLMGLPGQNPDQVAKTITYVGKAGAIPYLSEYSPIPHTAIWNDAVKVSRFDLASDPLFHNNTIFPCWSGEAFMDVRALKRMAQEVREEARKR
jgi:radical SAM superfamily enzyme YgiQ (UPF0313 family)